MIGKAKSCVGGFSLFNYVVDDEKGIELLRNNLCGETPIELFQEMKILQNLNQKATNKLISMVLSPHVNDGENLSKKQLENITKQFLKELEINIEKSQFIAFLHTEKLHRHIHILLNRVDQNGKLFQDHHIGKKAQWSAHRVAEKNGLISAKQIRIDKIKASEVINSNSKNLRKEIYQKHLKVIESKPLTMEKYLSEMLKQNVKFIPTINKQGELQGFRVRNMENQTEMKASDVHRNMGLKNLLDSGLFFQHENTDLNISMQKLNIINTQKYQQELQFALEKKKSKEVDSNISISNKISIDNNEKEIKYNTKFSR